MINSESLKKYIGIPFLSEGRTFNGADCWGLVSLFYENEYNFILPDYKIKASDFTKISEKMNAELLSDYQAIDKPVEGCIVLMRLGKSKDINHAAVYLGNNLMLQAYENTGSHIAHTDSLLWARIIKAYALPKGFICK